MSSPLTAADFPLWASGANVYRRTESSPMLIATDDYLATKIAHRLNVEEMRSWGAMKVFTAQGGVTLQAKE